MTAELLLEIGTEEIPSDYLDEGLKAFKELADACLEENRIKRKGSLSTYGTPRRLVLVGKGIAERQDDLVKEIWGPPKDVAYDGEGKPTKAALGFAQKQGVTVEDLECVETGKGDYLFVRREISGKDVMEILAGALPALISRIPWPKSMRWGDIGFSFVRPIHWILALFDGALIPFEAAGVRSGGTTYGHRFMAPEAIQVKGVLDYFEKLEKAFVVVDQDERRRVVEQVIQEAAQGVKGRPGRDPELVVTNANLVEFPTAVCGSFDRVFLDLPEPVLITAMKEHQKYFSVYDDEGSLMPYFVAVNNTLAKDQNLVQRGHERVLRARLSDARFFFDEDRKRSLEARMKDLKRVIYQADLGTSYAKVQRFLRLAQYLAEKVTPLRMEQVSTAASLCKCDLVTQMVTEFPSLQGVMGREYARLEGYPEDIASAIYEHYLPTRSGGDLPTSPVGAVVGCADRMDTVVGCFAIGLEPSGSADPFALRRHALAVIRIFQEMGWHVGLREFTEQALSVLEQDVSLDRDRTFARVIDFFTERYRQMMLRDDHEADLIEAVVSVDFDQLSRVTSKVDQLKEFTSRSEEFPALVQTYKRIVNILKKEKQTFQVDSARFKETCEAELWEAFRKVEGDVAGFLQKGDFCTAAEHLTRLRGPVDAFFEGVEVLTKEDDALRQNRVGILQHLARLFLSIADFSKFSL